MMATSSLSIGSRAALALLSLFALGCREARRDAGRGPEGAREEPDGVALYDRHCALCHGYDGLGDGPASLLLFPPARDFSAGRFRLVSTENGMPSDADLVRTLRRGMPGSAMPAFGWMAEEELAALARHVRWLAVEGTAERIVAEARESGGEATLADARDVAVRRFAPGPVLAVGEPAARDATTLATGRRAFEARCASCHGDDGAGRAARPTWNEDGSMNWARDFTAGILKGGGSHAALAWRIQAGLPGTAMPGTRFEDVDELGALIAYVQELIPHGAEDRLVLGRDTLRAERTDGALPRDPDDERWAAARALEVVLAPLWWRPDSIRHASLRAWHDGRELAVLVRWNDASRDDAQHGEYPFGDAVALQLSTDRAPSLFGMGSAGHAVDQWHWNALKRGEIGGWLDLLGDAAHRARDLGPEGERTDAPRYVPAEETEGEVQERRAAGIDAAGSPRRASALRADARWRDGVWEVVFTRSLAPDAARAVALEPGGGVQLALAIWNGAAGDLRGQKSISIWQALELAP